MSGNKIMDKLIQLEEYMDTLIDEKLEKQLMKINGRFDNMMNIMDEIKGMLRTQEIEQAANVAWMTRHYYNF
jgi:hypothetical protein